MNRERDLARMPGSPGPPIHDDDLAPGRDSRSSRMDAPAHPIAGGLIQRQVPGAAPAVRVYRDARSTGAMHGDIGQRIRDAQGSSGHALPAELRASLEHHLRADLSAVHVHAGAASAEAAQGMHARAFTVGQQIHFGRGTYDPGSTEGQRLIAHEVTHTVQQRGVAAAGDADYEFSSPGDASEREAHASAEAFRHAPAGPSPEVRGDAPAVSPIAATATPVHRALIQRDPIELNPVIIGPNPQAQAQSDRMMERFPEVWRGFCRDWYDAALSALNTAPEPADPYAARNFGIALAGNLGWAATSITIIGATGGAGAAIVIGASVLGAGAGSGAFATPAPPSGRGQVATVLAAQRGLAERAGTHSVFSDVAIQCVGQHISEPIPQDRKLWQAFAGRIDFDSRASIMLENAQQRLTRWLAEFQQQYLAWKARADVIAKARAYELGDSASGPYGDPWTILGDVVGVGTPADPFFDMAQRDIPLTILFTN